MLRRALGEQGYLEKITGLDKMYEEQEKEMEKLTDHQRSVLCEIQEEADALDELLDAPRLDRKKLKKAASSIWLMCNREL